MKFLVDSSYPIALVAVTDYETNKDILALCDSKGINCCRVDEALTDVKEGEYYWLINAWCSTIFKGDFLSKFTKRLNLHPSYYPWGRGSDSASWSILEQSKYGVSLIEMEEEIDAGGLYSRAEIEYDLTTKAAHLNDSAKHKLVELFAESWPAIFAERVVAQEVDKAIGSYHVKKDKMALTTIDHNEKTTFMELLRIAAALDFLPKTGAKIVVNGEEYFVEINLSRVIE